MFTTIVSELLPWAAARRSLVLCFTWHTRFWKGVSLRYPPRSIPANREPLSRRSRIPTFGTSHSFATKLKGVLLHMSIDTLILDPISILNAFVVSGIVEGKSLVREIIPQLRIDLG